MSDWTPPSKDLADLAEAALILGRDNLAQQLLAAAYSVADGRVAPEIGRLLEDIRRHALLDDRTIHLSPRQKSLLGMS